MSRLTRLLRSVLTLAVAMFAVLGAPAYAQTTGTVKGVVIDEGGLAIPGVVMTLESPALIGGVQQQESDGNGRFIFANLPPGLYALRATKPGFATIERPGLQVLIGRSVNLTLELPLQTAGEEIIVEETRPTLDTEQASKGQVLDKEFLERIPTGRSYQSAISAAPGVIGGSNPNVGGASYNENTYLLDGVTITDPVTGTFSVNFNFDAIEQIEVITGAYDAEYPQNLGGVVNIVTETGSNTLEFDASLYYQTADWAPKIDARYAADGAQLAPTGFDSTYILARVASKISGPIIRDKAWFIVSYQMDRSLIANVGIDLPRDYEGHYVLAKLTMQPTASHRFTAFIQSDPTTIDNTRQGNRYVEPEAQSRQAQGGFIGSLQWDWFLSPEVFLETKSTLQKSYIEASGVPCTHDVDLGYHRCEQDEAENSLDFETPAHYGINNAFSRDNYYIFQFDDRWRFRTETKLSLLQREFGGFHDVKAGAELDFQLWNRIAGYNGNTIFFDWNQIYYDPSTYEGYYWAEFSTPFDQTLKGMTIGGFLQDVYKPVDNLTFRYGLRYDYTRQGADTHETVINTGVWGPRFYVVWDPWGDEKTRLRGGYGRFNTLGTLGIANYLSASTVGGKYYFGEVIDEFTGTPTNMADYDPALNTDTANEFLSTPHSDEFTIGAAREIVQDLVFDASFTAKFTRNVFMFDETNVIWDEDGYNFLGTGDGTLNTYYRLRSPTVSRRDYYQTDVSLQKNFSDRWLLQTTYSYVVSRGTVQDSGGAGLAVPPQFELTYGNLPTDVRHQIKAYAAWDLPFDPWTTRLGLSAEYFSGYPVSRYYYTAGYGGSYQLKEPLGTYDRTEPIYYLSFMVQQAIDVRKGQLWAIASLENFVNAQQADSMTTAITSENRYYIYSRQNPIQLNLGVRYKF